MVRPPSSQPAVCSTKLTPARQVGIRVLADSKAACASGIFEAQRAPPERNGTPSRLARAAIVYSTRAGSGVPNVGAPDCIDREDAKLPSTTGAPGLMSWATVMPANASASVCATVPATVTGDIAPARMNGVTMVAWLARAYVFNAPSIVASQVIGELALIRLMTQVFGFPVAGSRYWSPKRMRDISTVSAARSAWVTEPMYGLSLYFMWLYTMSKCRVLTGRANGSQIVP